jgi:hypothetical protein
VKPAKLGREFRLSGPPPNGFAKKHTVPFAMTTRYDRPFTALSIAHIAYDASF